MRALVSRLVIRLLRPAVLAIVRERDAAVAAELNDLRRKVAAAIAEAIRSPEYAATFERKDHLSASPDRRGGS